jgi:cell division protein FtsW
MSLAMILPGVATSSGWRTARFDNALLVTIGALLCIGLVMVASSSMPTADRYGLGSFYYTFRQAAYMALGISLGLLVLRVPIAWWERGGFVCLMLALGLLVLVLVPGIGKTVNGSTRWIDLGVIRLQVSEAAKFLLIVYMAGYLVRHREQIEQTTIAFLKPMLLMSIAAILLLLEPDFGATVVLMLTCLVMMFMAGVKLWKFGVLLLVAVFAFAALAITSPYRLQRLTAFLNPWSDPFDSGFQLTQSLIAIGRGDWLGVGLGASIQKLFYLPEAHTDFVFAVLAEEVGLIGVCIVLSLYGFVIWRSYRIAETAQQNGNPFASYLAYGIGTWFALQILINIGVNTGLLPTKGLTLPLLSYGGSSMLSMCAAIALLLRIDFETRWTAKGLVATGSEAAKRRRAMQ